MPTSTPPDRSLTSSLLRGAALLLGVVAALSFWGCGRALHEFAKFDRMFAEMIGIVLGLGLGLIAVLLRGFAERLEDHDDGEPVRLAINDRKENQETH